MGKKSTKKKYVKTGQIKKNDIPLIYMFIFGGLSAILFFSPYFRGLFFPPEQEKALLLAAVVFILVCIDKLKNRETRFFHSPLDYFLLALPVVYLIATFNAVNYNLSINEIVKNTLYFLVFWIVVQSIRGERERSILLHIIYVSALGVALAGLATTVGIIDIKDGFALTPVVIISSTFQYHNALASYLGAVFFIGIYFWNRARQQNTEAAKVLSFIPEGLLRLKPQLLLYTGCNFLILSVFWGAGSRGGMLFFACAFLLYLILIGRDRLAIAVYTLLIGIPAYFLMEKFWDIIVVKQSGSALLWILLGLILVFAGQILYIIYEKQLTKLGACDEKKFKYIYGILGFVIVAGGLGVAYTSGVLNKILSFGYLRNAIERMYFVNDALEMIKERPFFGWGGGGWEEAYRYFQDYFYNSTQVHSYYFQVAVETGILGLLVLLGIMVGFIMLVYKLYRENKENHSQFQLIISLIAAALFIAGHAVMDFNLSLSALTLLLMTIFGLLVGMQNAVQKPAGEKPVKKNSSELRQGKEKLYLPILIAVIVFIGTASLALSGKYSNKAGASLANQDINSGLAYMEKAAKYNPLNPAYHLTLAQIYRGIGQKDKALDEVEKMLSYSEYNASIPLEASKLYYSLENVEQAVAQAEKAVSLAPYKIDGYENLADIYFTVGYNSLMQQKKDLAGEYFNKITGISEEINSRVNGLTDYQKKMWKDAPMLEPTPVIALKSGAARYFLGQYEQAAADLEVAARDKNLESDIPLWEALVVQKLGEQDKVQQILQEAEKDNPKIKQQFSGLSTLSIE